MLKKDKKIKRNKILVFKFLTQIQLMNKNQFEIKNALKSFQSKGFSQKFLSNQIRHHSNSQKSKQLKKFHSELLFVFPLTNIP